MLCTSGEIDSRIRGVDPFLVLDEPENGSTKFDLLSQILIQGVTDPGLSQAHREPESGTILTRTCLSKGTGYV